MLLKNRHSVVSIPSPIIFAAAFCLGLFIATYLRSSEHWGLTEKLYAVLFLVALIDCFFRIRWCAYKDSSIICRSWNKRYSCAASDAWIDIERNKSTKSLKVLINTMSLIPGGYRSFCSYEPWQIIIHVPGVAFPFGLVVAGSGENDITFIAETLHLPLKNPTLLAMDTEKKLHDYYRSVNYSDYAAILIVAIPLLLYLLFYQK